jgi:polysaccharide export outer membrane protein
VEIRLRSTPELGRVHRLLGLCVALSMVQVGAGQTPAPPTTAKPGNTSAAAPAPPAVPTGVAAPADYLIGPDDVLAVIFWREKDMSVEVGVRPDGRISLPLINEIQAAGLTPEQLRANITQAASKYIEDPTVAVVVKTINSRRVFITGQVSKPGPYPIMQPITVLQLLAIAGGVLEFADTENIGILRTVDGKPTRFRFNYKEVTRGKNLAQNIELKPGDQVIVP